MAPSSRSFTYCDGAPSWNPTTYIADTALHERAEALLAKDNLQSAIAASFSLPPPHRDPYVYHAIVSVTLPEVQRVISLGGQNGLHSWYFTAAAAAPPTALPPPPRADIDAYLSIFDPRTSTPAAALKTFASNAKKGSLRAEIAAYLLSKRYIHPALAPQLAAGKRANRKKKKKPASSDTTANANANNNNSSSSGGGGGGGGNSPQIPPNPSLPFHAFAIRALEFAGPCPSSLLGGHRAHHVLPILMHHFGCACPSHEALSILRVLSAGRGVVDMGSGGGYWTFMLRSYGVEVVAVDSMQSAWRVCWVADTVVGDGVGWLKRRRLANSNSSSSSSKANGRKGEIDPDEPVLLLVYPIVGGGVAGGAEGDFTRGMMDAYTGDTLAVVGTQNRNGYTGFRGMSMDEYVERERAADGWVKVVQVALPSFPGKDEALFVFQRGARAPVRDEGVGVDAGEVS